MGANPTGQIDHDPGDALVEAADGAKVRQPRAAVADLVRGDRQIVAGADRGVVVVVLRVVVEQAVAQDLARGHLDVDRGRHGRAGERAVAGREGDQDRARARAAGGVVVVDEPQFLLVVGHRIAAAEDQRAGRVGGRERARNTGQDWHRQHVAGVEGGHLDGHRRDVGHTGRAVHRGLHHVLDRHRAVGVAGGAVVVPAGGVVRGPEPAPTVKTMAAAC